MEPMETKALKPTFSRKLQSSTAVHSAPLWLMKATLPGRATERAKGRVQPANRIHHAQAVRADEPHLAANGLRDLPLQLLAVLAGLLEAGRDDDGAGMPSSTASAMMSGTVSAAW